VASSAALVSSVALARRGQFRSRPSASYKPSMKSVSSKKVALGMLAFGIGLGFLLNIAYHEDVWSWSGIVLGFLGGVFGLFLYARLDSNEP
jgi:H+/Cl- antiporter ClcA